MFNIADSLNAFVTSILTFVSDLLNAVFGGLAGFFNGISFL